MPEIKFIYFDVGGVLMLDYSKTNKWNEMISDLGIEANRREAFGKMFKDYTYDICTSRKSLDDFLVEAKKQLGIKIPKGYKMLEDFVNRFEPNPSLAEIVTKLKGYRLGLLTDQYKGMLDMVMERGLIPRVNWEVIIDSSMVGLKKPQVEIYQLAEELAEVKQENILFVENRTPQIKGAEKRRWQTLLYDPADVKASNKALKDKLCLYEQT